MATLVFALVGYYGMVQVRFGYGGSSGALALWSAGALVGGSVFGVLGPWWHDANRWRRAVAVGLLAAAAIAEGAYLSIILPSDGLAIAS